MSETETTLQQADDKLWGLLAEFDSPGALKKGAAAVHKAGYTKFDCYSPFAVHGIDGKMGIKMTILPVLVFVGGLVGASSGILLQWWANAYDWPWIVSGKPFFSLPAQIPIAFELTVLIAAFTTFFGMWILNKLPQHWHPLFRKDRFLRVTTDGFFIGIEAEDDKFDRQATEALLEGAGATAVESCHTSTDPNRRRVPAGVMAFVVASAALAIVPFAFIAHANTSKSRKPHLHIIPSLDFQDHRGPQTSSEIFEDRRTMRMPEEGTVARGELKADKAFYNGIEGGQWLTSFPKGVSVDKETIDRGQNRYAIYCSPCHDYTGRGKGIIAVRAEAVGATATGWNPPSDLMAENIVRQPHGQIFNTISNGIRTMRGYRAQIPEEDRWAIVLYLRALQRSQNALQSDIPPEKKQQLR